LILVFHGVFIAVPDVHADAYAALGFYICVEFLGALYGVGFVVRAELKEGFVAGAGEGEDLVLALDAHFCCVFVFVGEGMAEGGFYRRAGYGDVARCVGAGNNVRGWWGQTGC
jgi:hypothetical protein